MGYNKVITYGDLAEIYEYEKDLWFVGRKSKPKYNVQWTGTEFVFTDKNTDFDGNPIPKPSKQKKVRSKENARRAVLAFKRLISANLGRFDVPILASLTYADNMQDYDRARADFHLFAKRLQHKFGQHIRFICVPEFQKRGAVHFHTLFWGLPLEMVKQERTSREFATLWGKGFADLVQTNGSNKLATYLSKYMGKAFLDIKLSGKKAYSTSHNLKRPVVYKQVLLTAFEYYDKGFDLSTAQTLHEKTFDTQWLGKGRFRLLKLIPRI